MIAKYISTLAIAVSLVTFGASYLQFATRSQVLSGRAVDETFQFEFTLDADSTHTYRIKPSIKQFLEDHITFSVEGPVRVASAKVEVTPKDVHWSENRKTITSTGAALSAQLRWDTSPDSANGAHGSIYLDFPAIPVLGTKSATLHSGGYQTDDKGRYVIREVTTYRDTFLLSLGRFTFALAAGLPLGLLLHSICWAFVLKFEKRSRIAKLPPQGSGLPQTFYPNPVAEWIVWLLVVGIGAFVATMPAGFSAVEGFMSSTMIPVVYIILAIVGAVAVTVIYFYSRSLLTVRVDTNGISYARGRRADLQWVSATWTDILGLTERSRTYRGSTSYWIEVEFNDNRKKLKIAQTIEGYADLRGILRSVFAAKKPG